MAAWIVIAVLVVLVWLFFKAKGMQHKIYCIFLIAFLLFFYITGSRILEANNVSLKSFNGMVTAGKLYVEWLGNAFNNAKNLLGNALKMNWGNNSTLK